MKKTLIAIVLTLAVAVTAWAGGVADVVLENGILYIADNCNKLSIVSDTTVTPGTALSGYTELGSVAITTGIGNGDYTKADGDTSGRKVTLGSQEITMSATGTANNWILSDGTTVLVTDSVTSKSVSSGSTYSFGTIDPLEIRDAQ